MALGEMDLVGVGSIKLHRTSEHQPLLPFFQLGARGASSASLDPFPRNPVPLSSALSLSPKPSAEGLGYKKVGNSKSPP